MSMAAVLGSLNISAVLCSTMQDEPLSYCTYQKSHGKVSSVTVCIHVLYKLYLVRGYRLCVEAVNI